jgi:hypothetical protein
MAAEARYQAMLNAQRAKLIASATIMASLAEFMMIASIVSDIYWYYEKKERNRIQAKFFASQQLREWIIYDGLNPDSSAEDMFKDYVKYHEKDLEEFIQWMRDNGYENMIPE